MRKAKSLLGLQIITQADGKNLGTVRDLIFSENSQKLVALLLTDRELFGMIDATAVQWNAVREIGPNAIMVPGDDAAMKVHSDPVIAEGYDAHFKLDGKTVTTDAGENIGHISDLYLDDNGHIVAYEVSGGVFADALGGKRYMEAPRQITMGQDVIIVPQDVITQMERDRQNQPGGIAGVYDSAKDKVAGTYDNIADASVEKQREFVIGKTAGRDVILPAQSATLESPSAKATGDVEEMRFTALDGQLVTDLQKETNASATDLSSTGEVVNGEVLVRDGEVITEQHADRAISAGVLAQLVAAAGAGSGSSMLQSGQQSASGIGAKAQGLLGSASESAEGAALGKPSAREVMAPDGSVLVAPGQIVTQSILDRADTYGKKNEVIAAAGMGAVSQTAQTAYADVKETAANVWETIKEKTAELTGTAHEKKAEYDEASEEKKIKNALGRPVNRVILAKDDSVILNTGDIITHKAVDMARTADVLDALLDSVYDAAPDITPEMLRAKESGEAALPTQAQPTGGPITATVLPEQGATS